MTEITISLTICVSYSNNNKGRSAKQMTFYLLLPMYRTKSVEVPESLSAVEVETGLSRYA